MSWEILVKMANVTVIAIDHSGGRRTILLRLMTTAGIILTLVFSPKNSIIPADLEYSLINLIIYR